MRGLFFNAQPTTDIVAHPSGYDREYDSDDFNRYMGVFFGNGVFVRQDADACKVTASGLWLEVTPGIALVDGGQCHFEPGDGLTITQGDGQYSVMCRRNNAAAVRAFELVAVRGEEEYPAPVREGDFYDLCLAHVQVEDGVVTVTDSREDRELCGFAALTGQPPYYPPDEANLPYILWLYVLGLPMTLEQVEAVEGNPSLMEIFNNSRLVPATTEEAEAGTDDSKIMTPVKVKTAIGTAKETVLDKRINKLVRVRSRLKVVGESPLSFGFAQLMEMVNSTIPFCVNLDSKKFFSLGWSSDQKYVCASNMTQTSNLANYHREYVARASGYPTQNFSGNQCFSLDGSLIGITANRYSAVDYFIVDTQNPRVSAGLYNPHFAYRNATVWGYCGQMGSTINFYYGPISEGGNPSASSKSFAVASDSYRAYGVGVYNDKVYFVEKAGETLWQLGTFDLVTYTFSRGLLTFSNGGWPSFYLKPIFQDSQCAYMGVYTATSSCTTCLRIDMEGMSSNWSNISAPVTSAYTPIGNGGVYLGTIEGYGYSIKGTAPGNAWLIKIDKASGLLSYTGLTSESSITLSYSEGSMMERVVSLPGYENLIPVFNGLIDVEQSEILPLYYKTEIAQSGTTAELYFKPEGNMIFTGTRVNDIRLISVGRVSNTLNNNRYWATAAGANPEFSLFYKAGDIV